MKIPMIDCFNNSSCHRHLDVVKYINKTHHDDFEARDLSEQTSINKASLNGHLNIVKNIVETCNANVVTRVEMKSTSIKVILK